MSRLSRGVALVVAAALVTVGSMGPAFGAPAPKPGRPAAKARPPVLKPDSYLVPGVPRGLDTGLLPATGLQAFRAGESKVAAVPTDASGRTLVYIDGRNPAALRAAVTSVGGVVTHEANGRLRAAVPPSALTWLARQEDVAEVRRPEQAVPLGVTSEGVPASGADRWIRAGKRGAGVKVGIIDIDFAALSATQAAGELPGSGAGLTFNSAGCPTVDGSTHGTAIAEVVHDQAPDAALYLACGGDVVTFAEAARWMREQAVHVIVAAVGFPNTGRGDGSGSTGSPADVVQASRQAGILWVNAAGNQGQTHWTGNATDVNGNGLMEIRGTGESNAFTLEPGRSATVALKWDGWPTTRHDLDLVVMAKPHPPTGPTDPDLVAVSTRAQADSPDPLSPTEEVRFVNTTGHVRQYYVFVPTRTNSPSTRADLFILGDAGSLQFNSPSGSVLEPATSPFAIAVGASRPGRGVVQDYSSRGPTIDGRLKPDITGFDAVTTSVYGSTFAGTSVAAAHVAGAAALLKGANQALDASHLQVWLEERTAPRKRDHDWGHGLLALGPPVVPQPAQANGYTPFVAPRRLLDTTSSLGGHQRPFTAGEVFTLAVDGVPSDATAVVVNVTGSSAERTDIALYRDADAYTGVPTVSLAPGEKRSAMSVVALGNDRAVRIRNAAGIADLGVDLLGHFSPGGAGNYTPQDQPQRVFDSRAGIGGRQRPLGSGDVHVLPMRGALGVPGDATAVLVNVTVLEANAGGDIEVYAQDRPNQYTTLEVGPHQVRSNLVITAISDSDGAIRIRNDQGSVQVAVDLVGWFAPGAGARYVPLPRVTTLLDTRTGTGTGLQKGPAGPSGTVSAQVSDVGGIPRGVVATVLSVTGEADAVTSLAADPAERGRSGLASIDGIGPGRPVTGQVVPRLGATGQVRFRNEVGSTHVIAAVAGYFTGGAALPADPTSCRFDAEDGFTPIYDGRSAQSRRWRTAGSGTSGEENCETWANGTGLVRWYAAEHVPADFTVRLDWKATSQAADSGVYLAFPNPGTDSGLPGAPGVQIQIKPDGAGSTATGAVVGLRPPIAQAERPIGQWNTFDISVAGGRVTVRLNDAIINDAVLDEPNRRASPAFVGFEGGLASGAVRFRNIRVRADQPAARFGAVTGGDGKCLDAIGLTDGAPMVSWECHGRSNQMFTMPGDGTLRVLGKCVDAHGPLNNLGRSTAHLWACNDTVAQHWIMRPDGTLYHQGSNRCLDAPHPPYGPQLHMHDCHGGVNQRWTLPDRPARHGVITGFVGKCLDVPGSTEDGTPIHLFPCHGSWNQTFTVPGDGTLRVAGKCLDGNGPPMGGPGDQTVILWECNGTPAQQWVVRPDGTLFYAGSNRCLDSPGSGDSVTQYVHPCHAGAHQRWALPVAAPFGGLAQASPTRLVSSWQADEGSGSSLGDVTGNGYSAVLRAGASWGPGRSGGSLVLDGSGGYAATDRPVLQTTRSYSVAAWVKLTRNEGSHSVVGQDGEQASAFNLQHHESAGWLFAVRTPTGDTVSAKATDRSVLNEWTHVAGTYDSVNDKIRVYLNGRLQATEGVPKLWHASGPTTIGAAKRGGVPSDFWPGQIDDVRLFQGVLSDSEVSRLAQS